MENAAQPLAADDAGNDEQGASLREGLYILRNKKARTVLNLWSNNDVDCHGVWQNANADIGHQLWLIQHNRPSDTYTVKNLSYSRYLEVKSGTENPSRVLPRPRVTDDNARLYQEWWIEELAAGEYTLKCARTNTFLQIAEGNPADWTAVTCSEAATDRDHQIWILTRASRTGSEIKAIFESWRPNILPRIIQPHANQTHYFVLPHELRQQLWKDTTLLRQPVRPGVFDYNDFVIKSKDVVSSWTRDRYPVQVQGVSVLFGIMYGETRMGPKAYNWYLTSDMYSLVFFDAQTGQEYGSAALDGFGFEPTFVTF